MDAPLASFSFQAGYEHQGPPDDDADKSSSSNSKGPKRKRLAKACDACHKSKRRCDGTAPCSNCYFASKPCHYTDAAGRPVAAPHSGKPDASKAPRSINARYKIYSEEDQSRPSTAPQDSTDTERRQSRKRPKNVRPNVLLSQDTSDSLSTRDEGTQDRVAPLVLDHALTRELTNLFFTHCHPVRAIFHKPSFSAALAHHNRVPSYLLYAICALAAPLSRQPRFRSTTPARLSGIPFALEAVSHMFDGSGHLLCDHNLFTAQALCLLMAHSLATKDSGSLPNLRYRDLALQIVQALGLHESEHPVTSSVPSAEFINASIERESLLRIHWIIHILDLQVSVYTQSPVSLSDSRLRLRLPVDETSFELAVQTPSPEYLYSASGRAQWVSELGHLIRIFSLYAQAEHILTRPDTNLNTLLELEKRGEEWASNLPDNLQFSDQNLAVQKSMFETSSNTGAWCFCCMHVYHAGFTLALNAGKSHMMSYIPNASVPQAPQWTTTTLARIMEMLGDRAKNSVLMGAFIWIKYCNRDDAQIRGWCDEYTELWGTRIQDLVGPLAGARLDRVSQSSNTRFLPQTTGSAVTLASSLAASQMFPLGRSLDELRLHNHSTSWSSAPFADTGFRAAEKDEVPRRGTGTDAGSGRAGESLPSLKSSGLLDSWNLTNPGAPSAIHKRTVQTSPPPLMESDVRSIPLSSMPVGLKWLANESK